jgi:serine/threonine protein kinase
MTEDWTKQWERRIVNGVYPLRRFLGRSNHSVVFLTESQAHNLPQAAIKILPANRALTEAQLGHWRTVATLSHPHLIRLLDSDRCQLGGHNFLYVVTDLAEQNLAQILPGRPLTPGEVREILPATLDALAYLHTKSLVHGGIKPANFLVVGDQLKLACDTIRPAGQPTAGTAKPSLYDPPEARHGRVSTAGDIWALGITLVEALTQTAPAWSRDSSDSVALPATLAPEFVDMLRRCLNRDPGQRPTITQLAAQFKTPPATPPSGATSPSGTAPPSGGTPSSVAAPVMNEPLVRTLATQISPKTRQLVTAIAVGLFALWAAWTGVRLFHNHNAAKQTSTAIQPPPPAVSSPAAVESPQASIPAALPAVLHQVMPDLSRRARESIRGIIKIAVRASVDRSGNVVAAALDGRASSKYFAGAALDAAKQWKFSPAADPASRVWLLHFELTRSGTTASADPLR